MQDHFSFEKSIAEIDAWYLENLVCPRDHLELSFLNALLMCESGHRYPVIEGVPVMLVDGVPGTLEVMSASLALARSRCGESIRLGTLYLETLGISDEERKGIIRLAESKNDTLDPVVSYLVAATNGMMYRHLIGRLQAYPIPSCRCQMAMATSCWTSGVAGADGALRLRGKATYPWAWMLPWELSWQRGASRRSLECRLVLLWAMPVVCHSEIKPFRRYFHTA